MALAWPRRSRTPKYTAKRPSRRLFGWGLLLVATLFIAAGVFGGLIAGIGYTRGAALYIGLIGSALLLLLPLNLLLAIMFSATLVIVGLVGYASKINMVYWVPYFLGIILYIRYGLEKVGGNYHVRPGPTPSFVWWLVLFLMLLVTSAVINELQPMEILVASKNYLFMLSVLFILVYALRSERPFDFIWRGMFWVAALQVPVALYQYVFVGGRIVDAGGQGWDAVSGTMGGSESGGQSAGLGLVMLMVALLALALRRGGRLSLAWTVATCVASVVVLALAEIKAVVFVLMPLGLFMLYRRALLRDPRKLLGGALGVGALVVAILSAYQLLHYTRTEGSKLVEQTLVDRMVRGWVIETDPDAVSASTREMGRVAIVVHWWRENVLRGDALRAAFGHGPASLKLSPFNIGSVVVAYPHLKINRHTGGVLLWEVGWLGLAAYCAMLVAGLKLSSRLERDERIPPEHRAYLSVGTAMLALLLAAIFHSRLHFDLASWQLLSLLFLGQAGYWAVRLRQPQTAAARQMAPYVLSALPMRR